MEPVYWDTSALLSVFLQDVHSSEAGRWLNRDCAHLISSLACAEFYANIGRLSREGSLTAIEADRLVATFLRQPFRRIQADPDNGLLWALASRNRLRGADLWHLAMAKSLALDLPEIVLLSFDLRLSEAAAAEGLATVGA